MPRTLNRLGNAKQVAALKKPGWHGDGGGLYLRIQNGGARSWVLVSTKGGKRVERGLGSAAAVSLAEARQLRDNPPSAAAVPVKVPTFGEFADAFVAEHAPTFKNAKHRQQWENTLKTHAASLRPLRIDEVDTDAVLAVLRPMWTSANETASRLRGRIERILDAAAVAGHRDPDKRNPASWKGHLQVILPRRKKKREKRNHPAMPWADVPEFVGRLRAATDTSARALEFTILCAARTGETIGARVGEFDFDKGLWTIPADRMKAGLTHIVPLAPRALAIAQEMALAKKPGDFLFDGQRAGKGLSQQAMLEKLRGMAPGLTVHGFRSSFKDWSLDATDHPDQLSEFALAHVVGDNAKAAYLRTTMIEKRRALMVDWEGYLGGQVAGAA
jgi:integrase